MRIDEQYILLEDIKVHAFHGVFPEERQIGTDYIVNIKCGVDVDKAIKSDNINDTISYAYIYKVVQEEMAIPSNLIEHVAGRIMNRIIKECKKHLLSIRINIVKTNPPGCSDAGIELYKSLIFKKNITKKF